MSATVNLIKQLGGEMITYTPYGSADLEFLACVDRDRPTHDVQVTNGQRYSANTRQVLIAKDSEYGVLVIQERLDKIRMKKNLSDADTTLFVVQTVISEDDGFGNGNGAFIVLAQT